MCLIRNCAEKEYAAKMYRKHYNQEFLKNRGKSYSLVATPLFLERGLER